MSFSDIGCRVRWAFVAASVAHDLSAYRIGFSVERPSLLQRSQLAGLSLVNLNEILSSQVFRALDADLLENWALTPLRRSHC